MTIDGLAQAMDPREQKKYYLRITSVRTVFVVIAKGFFHLLSRMEFAGAENLPASGPVVLAANHMTNFDVFPLQFALPRPIFFMGKAELFRNPAVDWLLRQLGAFPVNRGGHDEWAMEYARRVLEQGQVLGIFPEGKRNRGGGLQQAKTGAARLALQAGCPIVPVAIQGTQSMLRSFPFRTRIRIQVGKPFQPHPGEDQVELTSRIMYRITSMLPDEDRGVYSPQPLEI